MTDSDKADLERAADTKTLSETGSGSASSTALPTGGNHVDMDPRKMVTRYVEVGALLKFARATGETNPMFIGSEGSQAKTERLMAPPTYVATLCDGLAGVFKPHPEHNMFLHTADTVVNYEPIYSGDNITAKAESRGLENKIGSRGPTIVERGLVTLTNQYGRTVATVEVEMRSFSTDATGRGND